MASVKVCVIGAGVIGLSVAHQILDTFSGINVTVIADKFSPETTSDGSAGIWEPFLVGSTPEDKVLKWGSSTFQHFLEIHQSDQAEAAGICLTSGYKFYSKKMETPFYESTFFGSRRVTQREIDSFLPKAKDGFFFTTFICICKKYLPWLQTRILERGGRLVRQKLKSIDELAGDYDVIINCSGLGSYYLFDDKSMIPIRGQLVRVRSALCATFLVYDGGPNRIIQIFPLRIEVALGGVAEEGSWDASVDKSTTESILKRCSEVWPSLKHAEVINEWSGLRPFRAKGVRIEKEMVKIGGRDIPVIHNYGHSGAGITLHWGCAQDTVMLLRQVLQSLPKSHL